MKNYFKLYLLTIVLFTDFVMFAQPGDDDGGGGLEGNDPPPAPINGKLLLLTIVGIFFIFYKLQTKKVKA